MVERKKDDPLSSLLSCESPVSAKQNIKKKFKLVRTFFILTPFTSELMVP